MRSKRNREFWVKIINAFERSGLEQRRFCSQQSLNYNSFQYWLYKLRRERDNRRQTALVRVKVAESAMAATPIEAGLPSGVVFRFAGDTDPRYVAALVAEVEKARC